MHQKNLIKSKVARARVRNHNVTLLKRRPANYNGAYFGQIFESQNY